MPERLVVQDFAESGIKGVVGRVGHRDIGYGKAFRDVLDGTGGVEVGRPGVAVGVKHDEYHRIVGRI